MIGRLVDQNGFGTGCELVYYKICRVSWEDELVVGRLMARYIASGYWRARRRGSNWPRLYWIMRPFCVSLQRGLCGIWWCSRGTQDLRCFPGWTRGRWLAPCRCGMRAHNCTFGFPDSEKRRRVECAESWLRGPDRQGGLQGRALSEGRW